MCVCVEVQMNGTKKKKKIDIEIIYQKPTEYLQIHTEKQKTIFVLNAKLPFDWLRVACNVKSIFEYTYMYI